MAALAWLVTGAFIDPRLDLAGQRWLGVATWIVLLTLLRRESALVRAQTLGVVALAASLEVLAKFLELYAYRLDNIPAFVPPGHGLVFLASLTLARWRPFAIRPLRSQALVIALGGAWAIWGLLLAPRSDTAGALFFVLWLGLMVGGRAPMLLTSAFVVTSIVELGGTASGSWTWAVTDPAGLLEAGNPPSGVAGIYGFVDIVVLAATRPLASVSSVTSTSVASVASVTSVTSVTSEWSSQPAS